jgi:deoxyribonuclease (pyrimidine dimer)
MTRINLVPPRELCDQHLLAEHRELTRIPNVLYRRMSNPDLSTTGIPLTYTVRTERDPSGGKGHVKFFYNKLGFLFLRYQDIMEECSIRGFNIQNCWSNEIESFFRGHRSLWGEYTPTEEALALNRERIRERTPENARWSI